MNQDPHDNDPTPDAAAAPGPGERVESWKAIAAYLKRSVTTVQRWEKGEGLPVHRHMHDQRGTPYAYKAELDAWWANRRPALEAKEAEAVKARSKRVAAMSAAALAVVLLAAAALVAWQRSHEPALPFEERDWALIAAFDNRTGEEVFDGTLEHALAHELTNSRYINVVPLDRVDDVLARMKLPYETPLTPEVAREVALRDGGIRALITGRAEKLDSTYLLSVALVDPAGGVQVASFREEASGQEQVVPALRRLSHRVRKGLGERLADVHDVNGGQFEQVTTPSLRALRLFSDGSRLKERGEYAAAEAALREAIAEDPEFASAHTWLAYVLRYQQGWPNAEVITHARTAVELSSGLADDERYFIQAAYHGFVGEHEKQVLALESLVRLRPDHPFGVSNLRSAYLLLRSPYYLAGRWTEYAELSARHADLDPENLWINALATESLLMAGEIERSLEFLDRTRALDSPGIRMHAPVAAAIVDLHSVRVHLANGDIEDALTILRALPPYHAGDQLARSNYLERLAYAYLDLGRLSDAELIVYETAYIGTDRETWRHYIPALISLYRDDLAGARKHAENLGPRWSPWGKSYQPYHVELFVRTGLLEKAREAFDRMEERPEYVPGEFALVRGLLALGEGRDEEAAGELQHALNHGNRLGILLPASVHLAGLLEAGGDPEGALRKLDPMVEDEQHAFLRPLSFHVLETPGTLSEFWFRAAAHRAQLLRKTGRLGEAEAVEAVLRRRLAVADDDHLIARELRETGTRMARSR